MEAGGGRVEKGRVKRWISLLVRWALPLVQPSLSVIFSPLFDPIVSLETTRSPSLFTHSHHPSQAGWLSALFSLLLLSPRCFVCMRRRCWLSSCCPRVIPSTVRIHDSAWMIAKHTHFERPRSEAKRAQRTSRLQRRLYFTERANATNHRATFIGTIALGVSVFLPNASILDSSSDALCGSRASCFRIVSRNRPDSHASAAAVRVRVPRSCFRVSSSLPCVLACSRHASAAHLRPLFPARACSLPHW